MDTGFENLNRDDPAARKGGGSYRGVGYEYRSLSIDQLAASLRNPERFLGLHFFNPVPASELVEIVAGDNHRGQDSTHVSGMSVAVTTRA